MLLLALDEEGCVPVGPTRWPNASLHLCRHGTHSALLAASLADASDVEMLLRVGGPHPQTIMFERTANARVWAAPFSLCMAGQYSLSTTLVLRQPWERGATPLASAGVQSLLEPTHGKPTKIALQASPGEQPLASGTFPARQSCAVHHLPSEQPLLMWLSGALSTVAHHTRRRRRAARSASGPGTRTRHRRRAMPSTGCRCDNRTATSIHMCRHTLCSIICATRSQVGAARLPWLLRQAGGEGSRTKRIYRRAWWWTSRAEYRTQACGRRARSPSALSVTRKCATWLTRW